MAGRSAALSPEQALAMAMNAARKEGAAILIVAHRAQVLGNADRLMVLAEGSVVQCGPRAEVLELLTQKGPPPNVVPIHERAKK